MYEVSTAYKNYIANNLERDYKVRLTVGTDVIDSDDIFSYSIETNQPSDKYTIGNAISQMLKIEIKNQDKPFYTNQLYLQIGMLVNGSYEYVPIGYFNVDKSEKKDHRTTITAYDNMYKLEGLYICNLGSTKTIKDIMDDIGTKTDIKMEADNYNNYIIADDIVGYSYREVIAMMAGLNGGNAYIDRTGKIKFVYLSNNTTKWSINDFYLFDGNSFKEQSYTIDKVTCYKDKDTSWSNGNLGTTPMTIEYENPFMTEAIAKDIYNKLANIEYQAFNMETMSYLALDVGDWISYTSQSNTVYSLCIQHYKFSGGIKQTLEAKTDGNKNNFNTSGSLTQKVNRTITDLLAAKKAIIGKANIDDLIAGKITFKTLNGETATIQDILTQFISGDNGQFLHLTSDNVVFDEAVIKDLIASHIAVSDLIADFINTSKIKISSEDGGMIITGNTQQFKDKNGNVRLQAGRDAEGNFTFVVIGEDGTTAVYDQNGITKNAVPDGLIVNDMVADNANIDGSKVNIESLIECVNNNNTKTLNASKIVIDGTTQTMDVSFNQINETIKNFDNRNLLLNTKLFDGDVWETNGTAALIEEKYKGLKVYAQTTNWSSYRQSYAFKKDQNYTFSFYAKSTVDNVQLKIYNTNESVEGNNVGGSNYEVTNNVATEWTRYNITFKALVSAEGLLRVEPTNITDLSGTLYICGLKLEKGNIATDYSEAPEDISDRTETLQTEFNVQQGQIDQLIKDTTIEDGETTVKLKDAYNETKSTVDGTVQTVANMETKVNSLNLTNLIRAGGGDYLSVDSSIWGKTNFVTTDMFTLDGATNNKWYRLLNTSSSTASNAGLIYVTNTTAIKAPSDKKISISFRYYCNDSNGKLDGIKHIRMYILQEHSNSGNFYNSYSYVDLDKTTAAKLYKGTFTLNSLCTRFMIRFDLANNALEDGVTTAFRFKDIVVCNGNIPANEWSPSFEDLQVDINSIEDRMSKVEVKTTDEAFTVQVQKNQNRVFNIRYIRDYMNGSNTSTTNVWTDVQALLNNGGNACYNKTVTGSCTINNTENIVDWNTSTYATSLNTGLQYITIDLGQIYNNIDEIKVFHAVDGRICDGTKTEVSSDGIHWVTLFDSAVSGTYPETVYGHSIKVNGTSFNSSQVTINELGLHILNGAIDISNNSGDVVFGADEDGNLDLVGNITTKNLTTGKRAMELVGNRFNFYDWADSATTRTDPIGAILTTHPTTGVTDIPGINIAHYKNCYTSISYYDENTQNYFPYITFDREFWKGGISPIEIYQNVNLNNVHTHWGRGVWVNGNNNNRLLVWINTLGDTDWSGKFAVVKEDENKDIFRVSPYAPNDNNDRIYCGTNTFIKGNLTVSGNKNCLQSTEHFGDIKFYATEDMGSYLTWRPEGDFFCDKKDSEGNYYTIIKIPEIVRECINTNLDYIVSIMKLDFGDYCFKTFPGYFKIISDKQLKFRIDYVKGYRIGFEQENYYNQIEEEVKITNKNKKHMANKQQKC